MTEHLAKPSVVENVSYQNAMKSRHIEMDKTEIETNFPVEYICYKCNTVFYKRTHIEKHLKLSFCDGKCLDTDKVVPIIKKLPGLLKNESHFQYKHHQCELCSKSFTNKKKLIQHIQTHSGVKPFRCETCYRGFSNSYSLKSHEKTHTGIKPYRCDICQKAFSHSHILINHKRTHHLNVNFVKNVLLHLER
jgi:KRAB domain-containing zinc finger protein